MIEVNGEILKPGVVVVGLGACANYSKQQAEFDASTALLVLQSYSSHSPLYPS